MAGAFTLHNKGIDAGQDLTLIQNIDFANIAGAFASGTGIMCSCSSRRPQFLKAKAEVQS